MEDIPREEGTWKYEQFINKHPLLQHLRKDIFKRRETILMLINSYYINYD